MDIVDASQRSRMMSSVRQRDTGPELVLRRCLHRMGFRYRLHDARLPGRPDLVFSRFGAAVFVHGCFWHAHGCRLSKVPATRTAFWEGKFAANRARDARVLAELHASGWRTLVVWQCALSGSRDVESSAASVGKWLRSGAGSTSLPRRPAER